MAQKIIQPVLVGFTPSKHGITALHFFQNNNTDNTLLVKGCLPLRPRNLRRKTKMEESKKKNRYMQIRLSQEEYDAIEKKFQNSGMRSRSDFIRAMIFEGIIVQFDKKELRKTNNLIANIGTNINQIAIRVNSTGRIYDDDFKQIENNQREIFKTFLSILSYFHRTNK